MTKAALSAITCIVLSAAPAIAQTYQAQAVLTSFEAQNVLAAAQCELGLFAKRTKFVAADDDHTRAKIVVEGKEIQTTEFRAGLPIFGGGYTQTITHRWKISGPRNLHPDNTQACARSRPALDIASCLTRQLPQLRSTSDNAECETTVSATKNVTAGGKVVWIVTAEISGGVSTQRQYTITVTAPPPK